MISIIPKPNGHVFIKHKRCKLPRQFSVDCGSFLPWCVQAFYLRTGCEMIEGTPWLILKKDINLPREGYRLCVSDEGATVYASEETGVVWALTTLFHLLDCGNMLPVCDISDHPRYEHRGLNLDCVRHFFSVETVKQVIDQISLVKMNVLHWHLTDDQAWRIESRAFPKLHESSNDYYTQDQIRDIVQYAQIRGVEIIPEIDLPGHATGILTAYPQYSCSGKKVELVTCGGIFSFVLCPGKEVTFEFLERLFDDICPLFPSSKFHIGGDEAPKTEWEKCPDCRRRMEAEGISSTEDLQGYFTIRVAAILEKHGKQVICWNDSLKAATLPENVQIQYWTIQHLVQMEAYLATGKPFVYSDMFDMYLDYPHGMIPLKKVYNSQLLIGSQKCGNAAGLRGMEVCLWTERIYNSEQLFRRLFPRAYALAEASWTQKKNYAGFKNRLVIYIKEQEQAGNICTPVDWWDPRGKARLEESIRYVREMFPDTYKDIQEQTEDIVQINATFLKAMLTGFFNIWDRPKVARALSKPGPNS